MGSQRVAAARASMLAATTMMTAVLAFSGCGSSASSAGTESASAATSVQADQALMAEIAFAQMMIPHHQQAIEMSQMALDPASGASADVRLLAQEIEAAQGPEIVLMEQWLVEWGVPYESDEDDSHGSHADDHMNAGGMDDMMGMLSDEQMAQLAAATGTQFDRLWLEGMIEHHEGAVDMAETVASESDDPRVNEFAQQIITTQLAEIAQMEQLLAQLA